MSDCDLRRTIVRLALAMMAADGHLTERERTVTNRLAQGGLGSLGALVASEVARAKRTPVDNAAACSTLAAAGPAAASAAFAVLVDVAVADGAFDERETRLLDSIAARLGLDEHTVSRVVRAAALRVAPMGASPAVSPESPIGRPAEPDAATATSRRSQATSGIAADDVLGTDPIETTAGTEALARAYAQLGVTPGADAAALDAAYRRLLARYDPTRALDHGAKFAVRAVRRLAEATAAYELLRMRTP